MKKEKNELIKTWLVSSVPAWLSSIPAGSICEGFHAFLFVEKCLILSFYISYFSITTEYWITFPANGKYWRFLTNWWFGYKLGFTISHKMGFTHFYTVYPLHLYILLCFTQGLLQTSWLLASSDTASVLQRFWMGLCNTQIWVT